MNTQPATNPHERHLPILIAILIVLTAVAALTLGITVGSRTATPPAATTPAATKPATDTNPTQLTLRAAWWMITAEDRAAILALWYAAEGDPTAEHGVAQLMADTLNQSGRSQRVTVGDAVVFLRWAAEQ